MRRAVVYLITRHDTVFALNIDDIALFSSGRVATIGGIRKRRLFAKYDGPFIIWKHRRVTKSRSFIYLFGLIFSGQPVRK